MTETYTDKNNIQRSSNKVNIQFKPVNVTTEKYIQQMSQKGINVIYSSNEENEYSKMYIDFYKNRYKRRSRV